jgi:hypothetical protein
MHTGLDSVSSFRLFKLEEEQKPVGWSVLKADPRPAATAPTPATPTPLAIARGEAKAPSAQDPSTQQIRGRLETRLRTASVSLDEAGLLSVRGSDANENIQVTRRDDGGVRVAVQSGHGRAGAQVATKDFAPGDVRNVLIEGGGGDDKIKSTVDGAMIDGGTGKNKIVSHANGATITANGALEVKGDGNVIKDGGTVDAEIEGAGNELQLGQTGGRDKVDMVGRHNTIAGGDVDVKSRNAPPAQGRAAGDAANRREAAEAKKDAARLAGDKQKLAEEDRTNAGPRARLGTAELDLTHVATDGRLIVKGSDKDEIIRVKRASDGGVDVEVAPKYGRGSTSTRHFKKDEVRSVDVRTGAGRDEVYNEIDGSVIRAGTGHKSIANRAKDVEIDTREATKTFIDSSGSGTTIEATGRDTTVVARGNAQLIKANGDVEVRGDNNRIEDGGSVVANVKGDGNAINLGQRSGRDKLTVEGRDNTIAGGDLVINSKATPPVARVREAPLRETPVRETQVRETQVRETPTRDGKVDPRHRDAIERYDHKLAKEELSPADQRRYDQVKRQLQTHRRAIDRLADESGLPAPLVASLWYSDQPSFASAAREGASPTACAAERRFIDRSVAQYRELRAFQMGLSIGRSTRDPSAMSCYADEYNRRRGNELGGRIAACWVILAFMHVARQR